MTWCESGNPFAHSGRWLKGALHAHTVESDGSQTPSALAEAYRRLGFNFLFFTDHNKATSLGPTPGGFQTFPGIEIGMGSKGPDKYWHFVGLCAEAIPIVPFDSPVKMYESFRSKVPFCFLAHPYWSQLTGKDLALFDGLAAVEVWNTGCEIEIGRGYSEYPWDWALGAGKRLMGVAVDDSHAPEHIGGGWVMLRTDDFTADGVIEALSKGLFYSSCGPEITEMRVTPSNIEVAASPCRSISFLSDRRCGKLVVAPKGGELTSASYALRGRETYVRVELVDAQGRKAWSNPIWPEWPVKQA